jgi:hypothetical protein
MGTTKKVWDRFMSEEEPNIDKIRAERRFRKEQQHKRVKSKKEKS